MIIEAANMHKKERPMMSVTQLLHGSGVGGQLMAQNFNAGGNSSAISPTGSSSIEQLQQQQALVNAVQQQQQQLLQQQQQVAAATVAAGLPSQSQTNVVVTTSPQVAPSVAVQHSANLASNTQAQQLLVQNTNSIACDNRTGSAIVGVVGPSNTTLIGNNISVQNAGSAAVAVSPVTPGGPAGRYPPNHPLSNSKHLCAICEDRASGKHYGVYSCEGCKGFFKRTVRKDLTYTCRDDSNQKCTVDKRQRNRCQFCRYQKCLDMGMKREAVQEERQRTRPENEVESSTPNTVSSNVAMNNHAPMNNTIGSSVVGPASVNNPALMNVNNNLLNNNNNTILQSNGLFSAKINSLTGNGLSNNNGLDTISRSSLDGPALNFPELTLERIMEAQKLVEVRSNLHITTSGTMKPAIKEIELLFRWIRHLPHFSSLPIEDQVTLVKTGWNELLIAELSYRSINRTDFVLVLANGQTVTMERMDELPQDMMRRIRDDLVFKFRDMKLDLNELGCLRAAVLFNPALKKLTDENTVELLRDCVFQNLETHCRQRYPTQATRFAKLVANRLPALRSIGLKCSSCLFYDSFQRETNKDISIDVFIKEMLQAKT